MSLVLNTNVASINAQRNLYYSQSDMAITFRRLSTGLRVNTAKDDAAGLYLIESQTRDIRGLAMATRNASDGISLAQTAEGALEQVNKNLQRINELAIQMANGTYNTEARKGVQKEVNQLSQEIYRIVRSTEFNGQKLLNSDAKDLVMQIGFRNNPESQIKGGILSGGLLETVEFGTIGGSNALSGILTFATPTAGLTQTGGTNGMNMTSQTNARNVIHKTRNAITAIAAIRATFGAMQNRYEAVISNNLVYSENLQAARSRIQDTDFAVETSNLAKQQVLQQAGMAVVTQANASSRNILSLLQ